MEAIAGYLKHLSLWTELQNGPLDTLVLEPEGWLVPSEGRKARCDFWNGISL